MTSVVFVPSASGTGSVSIVAPTTNSDQTVTLPDASGSLTIIPSGTVMLFRQTAAPTGWTKDTTNYNDSAIRVVTGSVSSGGSVGFTTAFASQTPAGSISISGGAVAAATLSTAQLASHDHTFRAGGSAIAGMGANTPAMGATVFNSFSSGQVQASGSGSSHTHTFTQPTGSFTGTAINLAVKYCDVIFATKD